MPYQSMILVDKAAENPRMLKLISVAVHRASPPITGMRERLTNNPAIEKKILHLSLITALPRPWPTDTVISKTEQNSEKKSQVTSEVLTSIFP